MNAAIPPAPTVVPRKIVDPSTMCGALSPPTVGDVRTVDDQGHERRGWIRVWLECDLAAAPIEGTLRGAEGAPVPFTGWAGLTAALERAALERWEQGGP